MALKLNCLLALLGVVLFTGCTSGKNPWSPCTSYYGTMSAPKYLFNRYNYSCEVIPIEGNFTLDANDIALNVPSNVAGVTAGEVANDVDSAIDAWTASGADWQLHYTIGVGEDEEDSLINGYNQIDILNGPDPYPDGDPVYAYAWHVDVGDDGTTDKCDIIIYTESETGVPEFKFVVDSPPSASDETDFAYLMAHEMGHCIGILDQLDMSTASDLMYNFIPYNTDLLSLPVHDKEAILYLYGVGI